MTGSTRRALERDIEQGFPFLPPEPRSSSTGKAKNLVLENIRSQVTKRWPNITAELRAHPTDDLGSSSPIPAWSWPTSCGATARGRAFAARPGWRCHGRDLGRRLSKRVRALCPRR